MSNVANPTFVAATVGTRKTRDRLASLAVQDARRRNAAKNGYRGPLTREEAARKFARDNAS